MSLDRLVCFLIFLALSASALWAKDGRTYYTPARLAAARDNIAAHNWAKQRMVQIMDQPPGDRSYDASGTNLVGATRQVARSDEQVFAMMAPIRLARKWAGTATGTCPVHGTDIKRYSAFYPWRYDFEKHPYKVICPLGGELYPSNDFAAGDLTSGAYPDDGTGCLKDGKRYQFINYWAHANYLMWVRPTISALAEAYLLTDDPRYAHKAAILLAALADQYPGPKYHSQECYGGAYGPRSGGVTDYIWECIIIPVLARAYDAIWPIYGQDPELLAFLRSKGLPAGSPAEARQFVEERLLRQAMQGLLDGALAGNPGHHQQAAAILATVLDDYSDTHPNSRDMMRFAYYAGYAPTGWVMSNYLTRDGGGFEGPGYDRIKFSYVRVAELMEELRQRHPEQYPVAEFPRVMSEPKARAMHSFFTEVLSLDYYTPEVGDAGGSWLNGQITPPQYLSTVPADCVAGYQRYREPWLATAALGVKGEMPLGLDLYAPSPEAELRQAAARPDAKINLGTRLLDAYGFAYLHSGQGPHRREAVVNYSALRGHQQDDYLSLSLFADEIAYLPDLGYPFTWDYRETWDSNLYTHNTVVVDGAKPVGPHQVGTGWVSLLGDAGWAQATAVAHEPYRHHETIAPEQPPVSRYERVCVMVEESATQAYLVDLFVVQGGQRHDQSWHSTVQPPALPSLPWADQPEGTAAGPEVPFNGKYVNLRGQEVTDGLCFVTGVKRAPLDKPATFHWSYKLSDTAGLRLHVVPLDGPKQLLYGTGRSPARPADWRLPYLFVRNQNVIEGLRTRFLTILEPYRGDSTPRITDVSASGDWPLRLKVTRGTAVDEITIYAPSAATGLHRGEPRAVGVAVRTLVGGKVGRSVRFGALSAKDPGVKRGRLLAVNRAANTVTLDGPLPADTRWLRLFSPGRSAMYHVTGTQAQGKRTVVTLKETSLLARGLPVGYQPGIIENDAPIPFATFPLNERDAQPVYHDCFAGARVESVDGKISLRLRGVDGRQWITGLSDYDLYLERPLPPAELLRLFGAPGQAPRFAVHDYGVGDTWEATLLRAP